MLLVFHMCICRIKRSKLGWVRSKKKTTTRLWFLVLGALHLPRMWSRSYAGIGEGAFAVSCDCLKWFCGGVLKIMVLWRMLGRARVRGGCKYSTLSTLLARWKSPVYIVKNCYNRRGPEQFETFEPLGYNGILWPLPFLRANPPPFCPEVA